MEPFDVQGFSDNATCYSLGPFIHLAGLTRRLLLLRDSGRYALWYRCFGYTLNTTECLGVREAL